MGVYFDPVSLGFIPEAWRTDGTYTEGTWPENAVLLDGEQEDRFWKREPPAGKQLGAANGLPAWVDPSPLTPVELAVAERLWRDREIEQIKWLRERHRDQQEIGGETTINAEQFGELLVYMQALRDWPQSPDFPVSAHRPVAPAWVDAQTE
jgi:hypothetical protein